MILRSFHSLCVPKPSHFLRLKILLSYSCSLHWGHSWRKVSLQTTIYIPFNKYLFVTQHTTLLTLIYNSYHHRIYISHFSVLNATQTISHTMSSVISISCLVTTSYLIKWLLYQEVGLKFAMVNLICILFSYL